MVEGGASGGEEGGGSLQFEEAPGLLLQQGLDR